MSSAGKILDVLAKEMFGGSYSPPPVIWWLESFMLVVVDSKALDARPTPIPSQKRASPAESRA